MSKQLLILFAVCIGLYAGSASAGTACPTPSLGISASSTLICSGTPVTFTALDSNAFSPSYQWYKNGMAVGLDSSIYIDASLNNNDSVWVVMTSTCAGTFIDTSTHIIMTVNLTPPLPTLNLAGGVCLGSDSLGVTFGGSATQVNWYWNGTPSGTQSLTPYGPIVVLSAAFSGIAPSGVYSHDGYLYVSDDDGQKVVRYTTAVTHGTWAPTVAGGNGLGTAADQFDIPRSAIIDPSGNLYIPDEDNYRIQMFPAGSDSTTNGTTVAGGNSFGTAGDQLTYPGCICMDTAGYLYVADNYNYRIQRFPPGSTSATDAVTVAGGNGNGSALNQIYYAEAICIDPQGNFYVADGGNSRVLKFPPNSTQSTMGTVVAGGNGYGAASNQLSFPVGVSLDAAGNLYVTDRDNQRVQMFPPGSTSATDGITVAGGNGSGQANNQFDYPITGVAFDSTDTYMFVVDNTNERVVRYQLKAYYTPPSAGSYTVTLSSAAGCVSGFSDTVTVSAPPVVMMTLDSLLQQNVLHVFGPGDTIWCAITGPNTFPLSGGSPSGGVYTGNNILNDTANIFFGNGNVDTVYYTYTNLSGCSATAIDSFELQACEGINTIPGEASISLYPNPNNGSFVLQSSDGVGKEYIITDMLGRIVDEQTITSNNQNIELQNISAGSYMLSVKGNNSRAVRFAVE